MVDATFNFGDVPTWIAAIGTVGALFAALWQIRTERNRRLAADERLRSERHLEQARLVAAYVGEEERRDTRPSGPTTTEGRTAVYLANNSPEPVYSVVTGLVFIQGAAPRTLEATLELNHGQHQRRGPITTVSILPGGLHRVWIDGTGWHGVLSGRSGAEVAFTDRAGAHWIRRATGELEELPKPPLDYFADCGFYGPHDLQQPERVAKP